MRPQTTSTGRRANVQSVGGWLGRIARLDLSAFAEIRADPSATAAAVSIVVVSSLLAGLGSWLWAAQHDFVDDTDVFVKSFIAGSIIQTVVWLLWVYMAWIVLTQGYAARADFRELTRVMGFAFAPVALSVLVCIGPLAVPIGLISMATAVLLTNAAIQQATDAAPGEAMVASLAGFSVFAVIMGIFANIFEVDGFGGLAPGILFFALDL